MAAKQIPSTIRKLIATRPSNKFREVVEIVSAPTPKPGDGELLVKNRYVGINASDINFSAGRYDPSTKYPLDLGFEAIGEVVSTGPNVSYKAGQAVMYVSYGAFRDYMLLKADRAVPLPSLKPEFLSFILSGNTAAISLDKVGEIKPGETVLVTAAAGGTGQIAVQWAKIMGCHVIGTCSTDDKVQFLKDLGCDRPVNYNKENLKDVLQKEYPKGLDVVYETIGGEMFDTCVDSLAVKGRLIIIGYITGYESDKGIIPSKTLMTLPARLLGKSASVRGFFLNNYNSDWAPYIMKQISYFNDGKLKSVVDLGQKTPQGPFNGLDRIVDAVESVIDLGQKTPQGLFKGIDRIMDALEYLYSKKSIGKIVVDLNAKL